MRIMFAIPLLLLGACQVSKGDNEVSVSYDQNTADNAIADVSNTAGVIAADIGNDVKESADKVKEKADEVQADHDSGDQAANASTNAN